MIAGGRRTGLVASGRATGPLPCGAMATQWEHDGAGALGLPRRVHLGRGHRGAPDRGRQRQQRLVGLGAQPRFGHGGAQRRRLRFVHPLARGRGPGGRARPVRLPFLARMEPDRTGRGGVLLCRAWSTTGGSAPPASVGGSVRSSRSTTSPPHCGWPHGRLGSARRAGLLCPLRDPGRRAPGGPDRVGLHDQRAQRGGRDGVLPGAVPAGREGRLPAVCRGQRVHGAGPSSGGGRAAVRTRGFPRGADAVDGRDRRRRGWCGVARCGRGDAGERLFAGHRRRRLRRRPVLHPDALRPRRTGRERSRRGGDPDGGRALAPGGGAHGAPRRRGQRAPDHRHRERDRHRRRHRAHRLPPRSDRECAPLRGRRHRPPGLLRLELAGQFRVAPGVWAQVRPGGGGTADLRAAAQAQRLLVRRGGPGQRARRRARRSGSPGTRRPTASLCPCFPGFAPSTPGSTPTRAARSSATRWSRSSPPRSPPSSSSWSTGWATCGPRS